MHRYSLLQIALSKLPADDAELEHFAPQLRLVLGNFLTQRGQFEEAISELREAKGLFGSLEMEEEVGHCIEGIRQAERALERDRREAEFWSSDVTDAIEEDE